MLSMTRARILYLTIVLITLKESKALFSENASNDDFSCPAYTTCPVACVRHIDDCPEEISCPEGTSLCVDGSCASNLEGGCKNEKLINPCIYDCASVACTKTDAFYDKCTDIFQDMYDYSEWCMFFTWANLEKKDQSSLPFVFFYAWISVITLSIFMWCAYNQRFRPVDGSTQELQEAVTEEEIDDSVDSEDSVVPWTQTCYRKSLVGNFLYILTMITLLMFHVLLGLFTVLYYWTEQGILLQYEPLFEDETQILFLFIVIWVVGFFWSLSFKWSESVKSLFLRRCLARQATQVAVFAPYKDPTSAFVTKKKNLSVINKIHQSVQRIFAAFGIFLFSDVNRPEALGSFQYCLVSTDQYGNRSFSFRMRRYIYDIPSGRFVPGCIDEKDILNETSHFESGLTTKQTIERRQILGLNTMDLPKPSFFKILINEMNKPFYHYQMYMIWTWFPLWYFYMAAVHASLVGMSALSVSYYHYQNEKSLYQLAQVEGTVMILKNGKLEEVDHLDLVPGDIVQIRPGETYTDMVIISGNHVITDESTLTGETSPVSKTKFERNDNSLSYDPVTNKTSTIFAGTTVVEAGESVFAVITKTGSFTAKGELVREILSYKRHSFNFDIEVQLVILILFVWAIVCFSIIIRLLDDGPVYDWFYGMFAISTCIPILLPTVFVESVGVSEVRLGKIDIACSEPEDILVAGNVTTAFFDKTGTLTKQGFGFHSVRSSEKWNAGNEEFGSGWLEIAMSLCHSLTISQKNILVGNSVDEVMFKSTKAKLRSSNDKSTVEMTDGSIFTVVKKFEFDHHKMTQSVIAVNEQGEMKVFVKGSAESIKTLCEPGTLPNNFDDAVKESAKNGIYQISVAMKSILGDYSTESNQNQDSDRNEVESNLQFLGFVNFKNEVKDESKDVLKQLKEGDIKTTMLTGDNVLTGIKIAFECDMIEEGTCVILGDQILPSGEIDWYDMTLKKSIPPLDPYDLPTSNVVLAVTGKVWQHLVITNQEYAIDICDHIRVYGRCTPQDKVNVVSCFIKKGETTLMCGDGGNDCGALKTAHVGIALSDAEASIVAPFTSLEKSIVSVVDILKEGRCALSSAFASYKYVLMYGQVATINQLACAYFYTTFSDWSWVFLDGIWLVVLAFSLPFAKPATTLAPFRPTSSLFGWQTLTSFLGVLAFNILFVAISLNLLFRQDWFLCRSKEADTSTDVFQFPDNYETEVIFIVSGFQIIISAMVYNLGYAHRAIWIKNHIFVLCSTVFVFIHIYITLVPGYISCVFRVNCDNEYIVGGLTTLTPTPIQNPFHSTVMPTEFRIYLLVILLVNLLTLMIWEYFVVNGLLPYMTRNLNGRSARAEDGKKMAEETEVNLEESTRSRTLL